MSAHAVSETLHFLYIILQSSHSHLSENIELR